MTKYTSIAEVNVRDNHRLNGNLVGRLAIGQEIESEGDPVVQDGHIWRKVLGEDFWIAERNEEGSNVYLRRSDDELIVSPATSFVTVMDKINVRDNPGLNSNIIGDVGRNQEINVDGEPVTKDNFIWRKLAGDNFWIAERSLDGALVFLKPLLHAETPATTSTMSTATTTSAAPEKVTVFVAVMDNVNVRNAPGLDMPIVERYSLGQGVSIVGDPAIRDGFLWRRIQGADERWIAERKTDNSFIILRQAQTSTLTPLDDDEEDERPTRNAVIPPNVDLDPKDYERTFRASLDITRAFEGGGFDTYQNYDKGIVSYGIVQFTLGSGSLGKVIDLYLGSSQTPIAQAIRAEYLDRVHRREESLRNDKRFHDLLKEAAKEKAMEEAQYGVATTDYWDVVLRNYVQRRGNLRLPLTYALLFDMGINFGVNHPYARLAEEALGVPSNSRPGENGITEQQLTTKIAELRRDSHYRQAERDNLPGLKVRGDFWVNLVKAGDWYLQGDDEGLVYPKQGVKVQVRHPF